MKPLAIFGLVGAFVMVGYAAYAIRTGRARFQVWVDDRAKKPISFWADIFIYLLIAAGFLFLAIKETFFSR